MVEKSLEAHFIKCLKEGNTKKALYIIKLLGDDVNKIYDHSSLLLWASSHGNVEVVKTLIENGAKVDEKDNRGYTALIWASEKGHIEVVKTLLDAGADVNIKEDGGKTALIWASMGHVEVVKALLSRGAKVDEKDNKGKTAIDWAYNDEIWKMLIQALMKQKVQKFKNFKNKISGFFGREQR